MLGRIANQIILVDIFFGYYSCITYTFYLKLMEKQIRAKSRSLQLRFVEIATYYHQFFLLFFFDRFQHADITVLWLRLLFLFLLLLLLLFFQLPLLPIFFDVLAQYAQLPFLSSSAFSYLILSSFFFSFFPLHFCIFLHLKFFFLSFLCFCYFSCFIFLSFSFNLRLNFLPLS